MPSLWPVFFNPELQHLKDVNPPVELAEVYQLLHCLLAVPQQELQGGALLWPVLQEAQLVIAHAPLAGKVPPVFDGGVVGVQL